MGHHVKISLHTSPKDIGMLSRLKFLNIILPLREKHHQCRRGKIKLKAYENETSKYSGLPFGHSQNSRSLPALTDSQRKTETCKRQKKKCQLGSFFPRPEEKSEPTSSNVLIYVSLSASSESFHSPNSQPLNR